MNEFKIYEDFLYQMDKCSEDIKNGDYQKAKDRVENYYQDISKTSIKNKEDIRPYIESISGNIQNKEYYRAKVLVDELNKRLCEYQRSLLFMDIRRNQ